MGTSIGLEPLKRSSEGTTQTPEFSFTLTPELRFGICDDEVVLLYIGGRVVSLLKLACGIDEVVEGTPKIMHTVPDDEGPAHEVGLRLPKLDYETDAGVMSATFDGKRVFATILPNPDFTIDCFEMFFSAA